MNFDLTPEQAQSLAPAIRGTLTLAQCEARGTHALLDEVYHPHRISADEVRAEAARLRAWESDGSGHCPHGMYTGGIGIDWMCGSC